MPEKKKFSEMKPIDLGIRSEEVQEILGYIPRWIVRWGITLIFVVIFGVLGGSWFFSYPDILTSSIVITSDNPPVSIIARSSGKIEHLFVEDNQSVKAEERLAVIENTANWEHVFKLQGELDVLKPFFETFESANLTPVSGDLSVGELQPFYANFLKNYTDFEHFVEVDFHRKKINSLNQELEYFRSYYGQIKRQRDILEEELRLSQKRHERNLILKEKKLISEEEFESSKTVLLQKEYAVEGAKTQLINTDIQIAQIRKSIMELELDYGEQKKNLHSSFRESYENLLNQTALWEYKYLLMSPVEGTVTFTTYWNINQDVNAGENVISVVPEDSARLMGKLKLPLQGSGKVKAGQEVNIKFLSYPYKEFGMVKGVVEKISLVASDNNYAIEISLPDGLMTNYGKRLAFSQEMQGVAEIITEDIRLLERLFNPIKSVLEQFK